MVDFVCLPSHDLRALCFATWHLTLIARYLHPCIPFVVYSELGVHRYLAFLIIFSDLGDSGRRGLELLLARHMLLSFQR
jgi:hypothetical protein